MNMQVTMGIILTTVLIGGAAQQVHADPRPNIVYVYADDLGWGSFKANTGTDTLTRSPTIDSLAEGGINFRRAYGSMLCSPARSTQQTGFHQGHTWSDRNDPAASKAVRADDKTIGDMLGGAGYRVGYYGKWGYGADSILIDPEINNIQTLPINHGYTDILAELHHVRAHTFFQPSLWFNNIDTHGTNTILKYNANVGGQKKEYVDDLYAEAAEAFIRKHANGPQPFFCEVAFQIPHTPYADVAEIPGWFDDYNDVDTSSWPALAKQYAAMLSRQDHHVASFLAALDDPNGDGNTNDSIRANTLVIFASDNGGQGGGQYTFFETNGKMVGTKGSVQEGGIRVPTFFNWPGVIEPGQVSDRITCVSDILPTLCELAGIVPPPGIDGTSIAPLLTGKGHLRVRPWYTYEGGGINWSLIRNDGYKLRNTGALYYIADGSNTDYEATNLLDDPSDPMYPTYVQWAEEMLAIALAERVEEPDEFANTYHHWIGADGANISEADNWSDYDYSNAGISHLSDDGAPRESWTSALTNRGTTDLTAVLDSDINVLSMDISGNAATGAQQTLSIDPGHILTGRNEIRLSPLAKVELNGGTLASTRWVDIFDGATLEGPGVIDATLYHAGILNITTNLIETTTYSTNIIPGMDGNQTISVTGAANSITKGFSDTGTLTTVLTDLVSEGSSPPQTLGHTITDLTLDADGTGNDSVRIEFEVTTDGSNIRTPNPDRFGWLSSGTVNLNGNGQYVQLSNTLIRVDLNGEAGNGFGTFAGFTGVNLGAWTAGDIAVVNGISQRYIDGSTNKKIALPNDPTLKAWYDTTAKTGANENAAGAWRPEGWDFQISISSEPIPSVTNITTRTVSSIGVVVSNDYFQAPTALLNASIGTYTSLVVNGTANLAGQLECTLPADFGAVHGDRFTILAANSITGAFNHADSMIEQDGHHFRIHYSATTVELEKVAVTTAGTPHWWFDEHGLTTEPYEVEEMLDRDHDGLTAGEEYIAGTLPGDPASVFAIEPEVQPTETGFMVQWHSVSNRLYNLHRSTDLTTGFQPLATGIPATPPKNNYTDITENEVSFYLIQTERK